MDWISLGPRPAHELGRHFEQMSAVTGDLLNATVRLEVVSRRLGRAGHELAGAKEA
jgi:hypothetical protein